jgi:hypothetical protein
MKKENKVIKKQNHIYAVSIYGVEQLQNCKNNFH